MSTFDDALTEIVSLRAEVTRLTARVKVLEEALRRMTPFPKCDSRCSSNHCAYDEDNRCDCGMEEIRMYAEQARAALAAKEEA